MRPSSCRRVGFNLVEVMFSILILGVGLVAVASLFPVAGTLQRRSYEEVLVYHAAGNVNSQMQSRGFWVLDLVVPLDAVAMWAPETGVGPVDEGVYTAEMFADAITDTQVRQVPRAVLNETDDPLIQIEWKPKQRTYPSDPGQARYLWVPFYYKPQPFVPVIEFGYFLLAVEEGVDYTEVRRQFADSFVVNPDDTTSEASKGRYPFVAWTKATPLPTDPSGAPVSVTTGQGYTTWTLEHAAPGGFHVGDLILDSVGGKKRVVEVVSDTVIRVDQAVTVVSEVSSSTLPRGVVNSSNLMQYKLYFAPSAGRSSPIRRIQNNVPDTLRP